MQLYGNKIWNDVTDNRHKAYFVMREDTFRAIAERLDAEGMNYYAYEQNGVYKMAVNAHDLRYFQEIAGDSLLAQTDRVEAARGNSPETIIGTADYHTIMDKRYFSSDIDLVLKVAEQLTARNIPFSCRVYDEHATITVSSEHERMVLQANSEILNARQQHHHAVSQRMVVGTVPYREIEQPTCFSSRMKPQEFMQTKPMLDATGIPYSGIVTTGGIILTADRRDAERFSIALNSAQTKQQSIDELQGAGFSAHQIALLDKTLTQFAEANDWSSMLTFVDARFSDEQLLHIADLAAKYIVQSEADRMFDRSGILLEIIHFRDDALKQIHFDEVFRDTSYSAEQRAALWELYQGGMAADTMRNALDESYSVEEIRRIGVCFRDSDIEGLRRIQQQHELNEPPVLTGIDPEPDDAAAAHYMHETEDAMRREIPAGAWQPVEDEDAEVPESEITGDTFQIYRLKDEANSLRIRFENYDTLQQLGFDIRAKNYTPIYTGALGGETATLDRIYFTFNANRPEDFDGYSLSVGDIIVLNQNGTRTAHMVDSIGFRELPDFFAERQEPQQDAPQQTDLFSLPYSDRDKQIFGNTPFRYIAGKTYHKMDAETAMQIAQELAAREIKFSGRIKGDSATLTIPAAEEEHYQEIAAQFIHADEPAQAAPVQAEAQPKEPAPVSDVDADQPLVLHVGDHIRLANDPQTTWIVTEVSDFILKLENADLAALASAQMMTGWQHHLNARNVTVLPEKGLPEPPPPKKRSARARHEAEGQLALFAAAEPEESDRRRELLVQEIMRGTGFENGKLRVSEYIEEHHPTAQELADCLKNEYGIGGHSGSGDVHFTDYDSKGIVIRTTDAQSYSYSWNETAKVIAELAAQGAYLTQQDIVEAIRSAHFYITEFRDDERKQYYAAIIEKYTKHPLTTEALAEAAEPVESEQPAEPIEVAASEDGLLRFVLIHQEDDVHPWNIQRWERSSTDEDFHDSGYGRHMNSEEDARSYAVAAVERYDNTHCAETIHTAVYDNYQDNIFRSDIALARVQEIYNTDRIALLLAVTALNADWDQRYSGEVRDWARKVILLHSNDEIRRAESVHFTVHPGLLNMLAETVMQEQAERTIAEPEIAEEHPPVPAAPAQQTAAPERPRNTMEHRIFKRMQELYPEVMQDSPTAHSYEHYESPNPGSGYEPFAIERISGIENGQCLISMMHTYEQNGDLMRDPDIVLRVDFEKKTATAISFQQDSMGLYHEYSDGSRGQRDTNRFMLTWMKNLRDQTREITRAAAEFEHDGTTYSIDLEYERGKLRKVICEENPAAAEAYAAAVGFMPEEAQSLHDGTEMDAESIAIRQREIEKAIVTMQRRLERADLTTEQRQELQDSIEFLQSEDAEHIEITAEAMDAFRAKKAQERAAAQAPETAAEFSGEIQVGDRFRYEGRECEVTQLSGLYPNDVTIAVRDQSGYALVQNIDRDTLTREGTYLGKQQPEQAQPQQDAAPTADFTITDDFSVAAGKKGKFQANIAAIQTLKAIESEGRTATPEEQKILVGYVGWGGIQEAFDSDNDAWTQEYTQLRELLTPEEYAAARASTENAHYTQPMIISEMYRALEQFGFTGGRVLEPAMGIGHFFGTMPEDMRRSSELYGVELDSISGRIAQQLYPSADIAVTGFERTQFNNGAFDVVVGNVPFGNYRVIDAAYDEERFKIHDYFLAKSMDKLKAGGIMAVVTSSGTMDKLDASARRYLAERAELIGAVRLPNDAFKANAGAEVTTDILIFRKRDEPLAADAPLPEWVDLSETADGLRVNSYFAEHPEMVLGTLQVSSNPFSSGVECVPLPDAELRTQLAEALGRLSAEISQERSDVPVRAEQVMDDAPLKTYFLRDGNLYFRDSAQKPAELLDLSGKKRERVIGMIGIRDAARAVIQAQTQNCSDEELQKLQAVLTERYDDFYKKYGLIHAKANAQVFREDDGFALICSLEKSYDLKKGILQAKADIFEKRTISIVAEANHADTAEDALILSMQYRGKIDFPHMSELCGKTKEELIADLSGKIYPVPDLAHPEHITYQTADEYLSGNIRTKLQEASTAAAQNPLFAANIPALEAVMPEKIRAGDITVRLGATWIPEKYIRQFMYETLQTPTYLQDSGTKGSSRYRANDRINVQFVPEAGLWHITNGKLDKSIRATRDFGTKAMSAYDILEDVLNLRSPKVYMSVPDPSSERGEKRVIDGDATSLAQKKAAALQQAFADWIFKDPERATELVDRYNELFNSTRPREYDGSHMIFPGMASDITLLPHQKNAVAHALYGGNALFAHCVGAGKTYEMIATAMEGKRLGLHKKSLFVVPKHLTEQVGEDFLRLYPSAKILVATSRDFQAGRRRELMARIATGNYDAVIISHEQFKMLPLSAERSTRAMQREVDSLTDSIEREKILSGGRSFTVKAMERQRRAIETQIEKQIAAAKRDEQNVTFEQLGIDHIFVDEAHEFKNRAKRCA